MCIRERSLFKGAEIDIGCWIDCDDGGIGRPHVFEKADEIDVDGTFENADAVIAILSTEDPNNIEISWTYSNIADYPVYVAVHSRLSENTVYMTQTYTVNTPDFEPGELQKSEDNYLFDNL